MSSAMSSTMSSIVSCAMACTISCAMSCAIIYNMNCAMSSTMSCALLVAWMLPSVGLSLLLAKGGSDTEEAEYAWLPAAALQPFIPGQPPGDGSAGAEGSDPALLESILAAERSLADKGNGAAPASSRLALDQADSDSDGGGLGKGV